MEDFSKIMEDAKQISEIMGNFSPTRSTSNENPMFANMSNIMNLMDIMKSFQTIGKPAPTPVAQPTGDSLPSNIMALRAMAPHMGEKNKKNIVIASKLMELMHFMRTMENQVNIESLDAPADNRSMLIAARPYIDSDKQDMVDLLITVMDISSILEKMERMNQINAKF